MADADKDEGVCIVPALATALAERYVVIAISVRYYGHPARYKVSDGSFLDLHLYLLFLPSTTEWSHSGPRQSCTDRTCLVC